MTMQTGEKTLNKENLLYFNKNARQALIKGVNLIADMVSSTLGPGGRNVVIEDSLGNPTVTKDGISVAKAVKLKKPYGLGAELIKKASQRVANKCGDGTTTVMVLTQKLIQELDFYLTKSKKNPKDVFNDLSKLIKEVELNLKNQSIPITNNLAYNIIYTSTNGDKEISDIIHKAYQLVGNTGVILVGESKSIQTRIDKASGYKFNAGYFSSQFLKDSTETKIEMSNVRFLIHDKKVERLEHIKQLLIECSQNKESLVIMADDIDVQVLTQLIINNRNGYMNVVFVKSPSYGENRYALLKDIAALTNSTVISQNDGIALWETRMEDLGKASKVVITHDSIIIEEPEINEVQKRKQLINATNISNDETISQYERDQAAQRMAQLENKTVTIAVGGYSEVDVKEKMDRYDDAIKSLKTAIMGGVVSGGGIGLINTIHSFININIDPLIKNLLSRTLESPLYKILDNAQISENENPFTNKNYYPYTILNGKVIGNKDFEKQGWHEAICYDPAIVQIEALNTAFEVAKTIINTNGIVLSDYNFNINSQDEYQF